MSAGARKRIVWGGVAPSPRAVFGHDGWPGATPRPCCGEPGRHLRRLCRMRTARACLTMLSLVLATGCAAGPSSPRTEPPPSLAASVSTDMPTSAMTVAAPPSVVFPSASSPPAAASITVAATSVLNGMAPTPEADPSCRIKDLAVAFVGGGPGAGNIIGLISLRNISPVPCLLDRPVTLLGLDATSTPVLATAILRSEPASPALLLTARTPAPPRGVATPPGQTIAAVVIAGEYRDGPAPNGMCPRQDEVTPKYWRVTLDAETVVVHNADPGGANGPGSIEACLGAFHTQPQSTL